MSEQEKLMSALKAAKPKTKDEAYAIAQRVLPGKAEPFKQWLESNWKHLEKML